MRGVRPLPGELPGVGLRQGAESEDAHPADAGRAAGGQRDRKLGEVYSEKVLWQCTTCGACENQCPVGIEHLPLIIGARRGLVSNGEAPEYLGAMYNHLERRRNIWGLGYDQRQKFVTAAGLETFDPPEHDVLVWLGCAGAFEADYQKSLRSLFEILRARSVRFGVLSKEQCTGDPAKRTGNEYMFQELANANIDELKRAGPKKILTSCPHCVKTIGEDYRRFGYEAEVVHSSVFVAELTARRLPPAPPGAPRDVTFTTRAIWGAMPASRRTARAARRGSAPTSIGARAQPGQPLLLRRRRRAAVRRQGRGAGPRISDVRLKQLQDTGADTVVTACPFCSIMLKGAQASAPPGERHPVRGPDDVRQRPADAFVTAATDWRASA